MAGGRGGLHAALDGAECIINITIIGIIHVRWTLANKVASSVIPDGGQKHNIKRGDFSVHIHHVNFPEVPSKTKRRRRSRAKEAAVLHILNTSVQNPRVRTDYVSFHSISVCVAWASAALWSISDIFLQQPVQIMFINEQYATQRRKHISPAPRLLCLSTETWTNSTQPPGRPFPLGIEIVCWNAQASIIQISHSMQRWFNAGCHFFP